MQSFFSKDDSIMRSGGFASFLQCGGGHVGHPDMTKWGWGGIWPDRYFWKTCAPQKLQCWPDRWVSSALVLHSFKTKYCFKNSPFSGFPNGSVKNLFAMQETQETPVQLLGWEDPRRRYWQPTLVFLPEKSHGQRILAGCSPMNHRVGYDWMIKHKHSAWLTLHWLPVFHYELKSLIVIKNRGLTGGAVVKNSANERDTGSIPGPGRSHMPRGN